jgi:hypothetical protein
MKFIVKSFNIEDNRTWEIESSDEQDAWDYWMDNYQSLEDDGDDFYIREV